VPETKPVSVCRSLSPLSRVPGAAPAAPGLLAASRVVEPPRGGLAVSMSGPVDGRARLCGKDDRIDGASVTERLELCSRAETENA
jgi:hypothetical protein